MIITPSLETVLEGRSSTLYSLYFTDEDANEAQGSKLLTYQGGLGLGLSIVPASPLLVSPTTVPTVEAVGIVWPVSA